MKALLAGLLASLLLGALARAGEARAGPPRRTVVRFDGDNIDGRLQRPDGDLVSSRPVLDLPSLARPPSSFTRSSRRDLLEAADAAAPAR